MSDNDFRTRLVLSVIDSLLDGDPTVNIGIGSKELRITWGTPGKYRNVSDESRVHPEPFG